MRDIRLTASEQRFKSWMRISAWMYGLAGLHFLVAGSRIPADINRISERLFNLPLYPLPHAEPEGAFWRVLSVSMMAMITWISWSAALDLRRNGHRVPILLFSKFCSSTFYFFFFCFHRELAYLVGWMTDGTLFLITAALWFPASTQDRYLSQSEEEAWVAMGEAVLPKGGAFEAGFEDLKESCLRDVRRFLSSQTSASLLGLRLLLRFTDLSPLLILFRLKTLRGLTIPERQEVLESLQNREFSLWRLLFVSVRMTILLPFFNQPEIERAVGYARSEGEDSP